MSKQNIKKLAAMAVAVVMAGSMAFTLTACGPADDSNDNYVPDTSNLPEGLVPNVTTEDGVVKLTYAEGTTLRMNVGNSNASNPQGITYTDKNILKTITLPDGKQYSAGDLKPAWAEASEVLGIKFTNEYTNLGNAEQLTTPINGNKLGNYDVITAGASTMTQYTQHLLNLTDYLDFMPNYKAFLDANPSVYYSLTSDTSNGAMYYGPYFDGMNDIEKYVLTEQTWIANILTADDTKLAAETTTFAAQGQAKGLTTTAASAESYMGKTGSWEVDSVGTDGKTIVKVKVDYDAALTAVKSASSDLGKAYQAAAGAAYTGTSGNIVDIMNAAINAKSGAVTGGQLTKILQEYIDVTYTINGAAYANRTDVFNSLSAAWDVDLLVAVSRCAVSSPTLIGTTSANLANIYGIAGRENKTQRRSDLYAFAGELYGIRGMESRAEFIYLDASGRIKDARQNAESYDLVANFSDLAKEGIIYTGDDKVNAQRDFTSVSPLFMHDYTQTQTTTGFKDSKYNVSPILTPVSKWDTDDNGSHETIMRFTESWRSVKNTGFCVPIEAVKNNPDRLSAVLAFIDYLFSNDGQIVMTYGSQSTNGNTNPNGWWYADEADVELEDVAEQVEVVTSNGKVAKSTQYTIKAEYKSQYFVFENKVYKGMVPYSRAIPKVTDDSFTLFSGGTVNGVKLNDTVTNGIPASAYSYTNYARHVLGTTLPIGNKDQGFEYQCTAQCALDGAATVSEAERLGVIKHVKLSLDEGDTNWYMIAPTSFALNSAQQGILNSAEQTDISGMYFYNESKTNYLTNIYIDLAFYGFDTSRDICGSQTAGKIKASGAEFVTFLNGKGLDDRIETYYDAWLQTAVYYGIIG